MYGMHGIHYYQPRDGSRHFLTRGWNIKVGDPIILYLQFIV